MARDIMFFTFDEVAAAGPYDERPMLPDDIDPQLHLSRNDRPQPFFLICQHDTLIATLKGEGRVEFKDAPVLYHRYETGDFLYVPAGTPSRILPETESVQYRYKGQDAGLEGVAWYCEGCGAELYREVWNTVAEIPQAAYRRIIEAFNADAARRICSGCGAVHPEIDLAGYRWDAIAAEIAEARASSKKKKRQPADAEA